jgi:L-fucose isomerase-like protein
MKKVGHRRRIEPSISAAFDTRHASESPPTSGALQTRIKPGPITLYRL